MRALKKIGTLWYGALYRWNATRRAEHDIHRSSVVSRRNCANCLSGGMEGLQLFRRCDSTGLTVHRHDICRKFARKRDD